jgi:hypothetical protein
MQSEAGVHQLCQQIELAVQESEQAIDALCMQLAIDDEQSAQLNGICFALKRLCVESTNRAQLMEQFAARTLTKMAELHALYQKLGGKEPRLIHEGATTVTLCAPNAAIFLAPSTSTPPPLQRPLRPDVAQHFEQERRLLQDWLLECRRIDQWVEPDITALLARRDALHGAELRELALFTIDAALHSVVAQLQRQQQNLRHHQSNTVARYSACARLHEAATRVQAPPTTMVTMFAPTTTAPLLPLLGGDHVQQTLGK